MSREPVPLLPETLAGLFGFTLDELALNRDGKLSARQRQNVFYQSWGYLMRGIALVVFGTGLTIILGRTVDSARDRVLIAGIAVLQAVCAAFLILNTYRVLRPTVRTVTGPLRRGDDAWHPAVTVGGETVRISYRRWRRLQHAYPGTYRAYIDPAGRLLSVEPVLEDCCS